MLNCSPRMSTLDSLVCLHLIFYGMYLYSILWTGALGDWQSTCLNRDLFLSCAFYVPLCASLFLVSFGFHL
jgi:hypothetical protein